MADGDGVEDDLFVRKEAMGADGDTGFGGDTAGGDLVEGGPAQEAGGGVKWLTVSLLRSCRGVRRTAGCGMGEGAGHH